MKTRLVYVLDRRNYVTHEDGSNRYLIADIGGVQLSFPIGDLRYPNKQIKLVLEYESEENAKPGE